MFNTTKARAWRGAACLLFVLLCACDRGASGTNKRPLVVFAASSMTEALGHLERDFEGSHPQIDVQLHFAGSQALRLQIEQGAPADVYVSANKAHSDALADAKMTSEPHVLAYNELILITPTDNPSKIESFAGLKSARAIVVGAPEVPVGMYTDALLERARQELGEAFVDEVSSRIVSREQNVRLVRAKVELGEADAAIVYKTDALARERVQMIRLPEALRIRSTYTASLVKPPSRKVSRDAELFLQAMLAPRGKQLLVEHGFLTELP